MNKLCAYLKASQVIDVGGEIRGKKTIRWTGNLIIGVICFLQISKIGNTMITLI